MSIRAAVLIFMAGFAASVAQIVVLREFLVIFYGNELSSGLVLAGWLLSTALGCLLAGRIYRESPPGLASLLLGFALFCAALPATVVWIRAARVVWSIPLGELISPGAMMLIALTGTVPICLLSGGLFALGWSLFRSAAGHNIGISSPIYLAEAAGSCIGGVFFYFVLLPLFPSVCRERGAEYPPTRSGLRSCRGIPIPPPGFFHRNAAGDPDPALCRPGFSGKD